MQERTYYLMRFNFEIRRIKTLYVYRVELLSKTLFNQNYKLKFNHTYILYGTARGRLRYRNE